MEARNILDYNIQILMPFPCQEYDNCCSFDWCDWAIDIAIWSRTFRFYLCDLTFYITESDIFKIILFGTKSLYTVFKTNPSFVDTHIPAQRYYAVSGLWCHGFCELKTFMRVISLWSNQSDFNSACFKMA